MVKGGIKKVNIEWLFKIMKDKTNDESLLAGISAEEEREMELATTHSEGIEIGEKRGEKRGKKREKVEITKNLLKKGYPEKMISKVTKLSLSEINAIKLNLT